MRHNAPWNIKNESNNLLHGSVAKLANHFMIWARRLFSTNLNSVEKTNDNKKNTNEKCGQRGKKMVSHLYVQIRIGYLVCIIYVVGS